MLTLRNLNLLDRPVPDGHIQHWFWHGVTTKQAIQSAIPDSKFKPALLLVPYCNLSLSHLDLGKAKSVYMVSCCKLNIAARLCCRGYMLLACLSGSFLVSFVTIESLASGDLHIFSCSLGKAIIDDPNFPAFPESAEEAHARINAVLEVSTP